MIKVIVGTEEYFLKGDKECWAFGKKVKNKKAEGGSQFSAEFYYSSTEGMIKALLEKKLRASEANTLTELKIALEKAKDELSGMYDVS